jgi:ankyrin repeat protein
MKLTAYLLQRGADVNAKAAHFGGVTALQGASIRGNIRIVMMLLIAGADINRAPAIENGHTAIEGAAANGRLDTLHLLLNVHPDSEDFQLRRKRAAKLASASGHYAIARFLTAYRKNDSRGWS